MQETPNNCFNNCCEFLASYGVIIPSVIQSFEAQLNSQQNFCSTLKLCQWEKTRERISILQFAGKHKLSQKKKNKKRGK